MLRRVDNFRHNASAFSLAELVVSVGVLTVMLLLAGQVMTLTVRSTGQAKAITTTSSRLRAFEENLRHLLRGVRAGNSVLLIQGNPINAYWSQAGKDADNDANPANGYPHPADPEREDPNNGNNLLPPRADILMFTTAVAGTSAVDPRVSAGMQHVVLGHARLGEYVPEAGGVDLDQDEGPFEIRLDADPFPVGPNGAPSSSIVSPLTAERWHLAQRSILLLPPPESFVNANGRVYPKVLHAKNPAPTGQPNFDSDPGRQLLVGMWDIVDNFNYDLRVLTPANPPMTNAEPYTGVPPWYLPSVFNSNGVTGGFVPYQRTIIDLTPPAAYGERLSSYMLANCASFKVEWSLNPRSAIVDGRLDGEGEVYWIDPGDLTSGTTGDPNCLASFDRKIEELEEDGSDAALQREGRLYDLINGRHGQTGSQLYSIRERLRDDPDWRLPPSPPDRTATHVFTARRLDNNGQLVPDDLFPHSLRITVDVYDDERRLERPIRHVMIVPVGG